MGKREYGQYCGLARALEMVGERWALLIVRDLFVGPRRYTDLRKGLPKIPTNILSARLKEMEAAGIIHRRVLPRPDGSVVYELTPSGRELEPIVLMLGRWGARALGEPRPGEIITPELLIMGIRSAFRPEAALGVRAGYELRIGEIVLAIVVEDGSLTVNEGPAVRPDLVIEAEPQFKSVLARELTPDEAIAAGHVRLTGDPGLLKQLIEMVHL
ncbi:winged helix-turn-helix transcriptional regulator [Nonomuraea typhae]|uniref:winged helix-turn-helix transcriptional regulator n=1 Tax=Nonomuraea typhae TaxID=2603600 RepID=UPI0012F82955|nr:winged helix-turn-helix transcriptional regulator [Nonomuraea typhae]